MNDPNTMVSAPELFQALALCALVAEPERRQSLMRGVLQEMASVSPEASATRDPAWSDVAALVVRPRIRTRRSSPHSGERPGLWLEVSPGRDPWPVGAVVQWTWRIQGRKQCVVGRVEQQSPIRVRVHRDFYTQVGEPVAEFVRAYDGLCRLGFSATHAQTVLGQVDPVFLLEIVTRAYHKRNELHSPVAYVQACIRSNQAA